MRKPDNEKGMTSAQSCSVMGAVSNNAKPNSTPLYGIVRVIAAEKITANNRYLLLVNPTLKAFFVSERQFHTITSSWLLA
ncbi:MAG: hypothetical protein QXL67_00920 [Candidatus Bathyarchaeia archaeon]